MKPQVALFANRVAQQVQPLGAPAGGLQVVIDAAKTSQPVSPLVFGGCMEPATTRSLGRDAFSPLSMETMAAGGASGIRGDGYHASGLPEMVRVPPIGISVYEFQIFSLLTRKTENEDIISKEFF